MNCAQCRGPIEAGTAFCPRCGLAQNLVRPPTANAPPTQPTFIARPEIPTYLASAIVVTVLCCAPFGIVAIVHASRVSTQIASNDFDGAAMSSRKAKKWSWISFWSGLVVWVVWLAIDAASAFA